MPKGTVKNYCTLGCGMHRNGNLQPILIPINRMCTWCYCCCNARWWFGVLQFICHMSYVNSKCRTPPLEKVCIYYVLSIITLTTLTKWPGMKGCFLPISPCQSTMYISADTDVTPMYWCIPKKKNQQNRTYQNILINILVPLAESVKSLNLAVVCEETYYRIEELLKLCVYLCN